MCTSKARQGACLATGAHKARQDRSSCSVQGWYLLLAVVVGRFSTLHRCGEATCTVCSRTCTGPCLPATLPLDSVEMQAQSPRRFALTLNSANTNSNSTAGVGSNSGPGKRKKLAEGMRLDDGDENEGTSCGRTVCKNCCFESNQKYVVPVYGLSWDRCLYFGFAVTRLLVTTVTGLVELTM